MDKDTKGGTHERARALRARDARSDHDRLAGYAERYFQRSGRTEWPTVRMAAKALRMTYDDVETGVDGDPDCRMQLTSYQVGFEFPRSEHFVECLDVCPHGNSLPPGEDASCGCRGPSEEG